MKIGVLACCFSLLCSQGAQATVCHAKSIYHSVLSGPGAIYVQSFFDGVFASDDGGATWHAAKDVPTKYVPEYFVAVAGRIFTLSKDGVLFESRDNGMNWQDHEAVGQVSQLSSNGGVLHACAADKRTILAWDGDASRWRTVATIKGDFYGGYERGPECRYVHIRGATITASGNDAVYSSIDGGKRWKTASAPDYPHPYAAGEDRRLHVDGDGVLYSTRITRSGAERMQEAYYSRDSGKSWRPLPNLIEGELTGRPHRIEAVHGRDLYLVPEEGFERTVTALYRSRDGKPAGKLIDLTEPRSFGSFKSLQVSGRTLLITRNEGLHISLDDGVTWRTVKNVEISRKYTEYCT